MSEARMDGDCWGVLGGRPWERRAEGDLDARGRRLASRARAACSASAT